MKRKKLKCIDKDIMNCNLEERTNYYHSVSKGQVVAILNLFIDDKGK